MFGNVTRYFYDGSIARTRAGAGPHRLGPGGRRPHRRRRSSGSRTTRPPTPDPAQGGGDGIIRTGWNWDKNSLLSSLVDDQGNVTVYLYDNLNRKVTETKGLTVNSTLTNANILGPRVVPTPTAATINNPAVIPAAADRRATGRGQGAVDGVAAALPVAGRPGGRPPAHHDRLGLRPGRQRPDPCRTRTTPRPSRSTTRSTARSPSASSAPGQSDSFAGDPIFAPAPVSDPHRTPARAFPAVVGTTKQDFQYDGLSRLTRATDNNDPTTAADDSVVTDAYDSLGRIIEEAQTIGGLPSQGHLLGLAGREPPQQADLPQRPRRGLHLRPPGSQADVASTVRRIGRPSSGSASGRSRSSSPGSRSASRSLCSGWPWSSPGC